MGERLVGVPMTRAKVVAFNLSQAGFKKKKKKKTLPEQTYDANTNQR